ncbi:MAG: hypothetical protein GWP14_03215 [Actinobacteria bacterium]|nr:hypothetical protein [Actinomycetota bacterium]
MSRWAAGILVIQTVLLVLGGAGCTPPVQRPTAEVVFYPPLPQEPRIQFLRTLAYAEDVEPGPGALELFVLGEEAGKRQDQPIKRPYGMALWEDKLYVCDSGDRKGVIFDFKRRKFRTFGQKGAYRFKMPINVSVGPEGEKYITDITAAAVFVFDRQDRPLRQITNPQLLKPCDALWYEGELFVADLKSNTILVLDPSSGRLLRRLGKQGSEPGEFFWPTNLAFGPKGNLYVCDTLNARVQVIDRKTGKLIKLIGSLGLSLGKMVRPKGIAVDREGRLYVADAATESVQIFNPEGKLLLMLGAAGDGPGDMLLPAKVMISYEGLDRFAEYADPDFKIEYLIFVSNQLGVRKINVYGFGVYQGVLPEETPEKTPAETVPEKTPAEPMPEKTPAEPMPEQT